MIRASADSSKRFAGDSLGTLVSGRLQDVKESQFFALVYDRLERLDQSMCGIKPLSILRLIRGVPCDCEELWLRSLNMKLNYSWFSMLPTADAVGLFLHSQMPMEQRRFKSSEDCKAKLTRLLEECRKEIAAILFLAGEGTPFKQCTEGLLTQPWPKIEPEKSLVDAVFERVQLACELDATLARDWQQYREKQTREEQKMSSEEGLRRLISDLRGGGMSVNCHPRGFDRISDYLEAKDLQLTPAQKSFLRATFCQSYVNHLSSPGSGTTDSSALEAPPICKYVDLDFNLSLFREAGSISRLAFRSKTPSVELSKGICAATRKLATEIVWWAKESDDAGVAFINSLSEEPLNILRPVALDFLNHPLNIPENYWSGRGIRIRASTYLLALTLHPEFVPPNEHVSELYRTWLGEGQWSLNGPTAVVWNILSSNRRLREPNQEDAEAAFLDGIRSSLQAGWEFPKLALALRQIKLRGLSIDLAKLDSLNVIEKDEVGKGTVEKHFREALVEAIITTDEGTSQQYGIFAEWLSKEPLTPEETAVAVLRYLPRFNSRRNHHHFFSFIKEHSTGELPGFFTDQLLRLYLPTLWTGDQFGEIASASKIAAFCEAFQVKCPMDVFVQVRSHALKWLTIRGPSCFPSRSEDDNDPPPALNIYNDQLNRMKRVKTLVDNPAEIPPVSSAEVDELIRMLEVHEWGKRDGRELYTKALRSIASGELEF